MNKDDYLDKKIPEDAGEPDWHDSEVHMENGSTIKFKKYDDIDWYRQQDKDKEWIEKTEKELF